MFVGVVFTTCHTEQYDNACKTDKHFLSKVASSDSAMPCIGESPNYYYNTDTAKSLQALYFLI